MCGLCVCVVVVVCEVLERGMLSRAHTDECV